MGMGISVREMADRENMDRESMDRESMAKESATREVSSEGTNMQTRALLLRFRLAIGAGLFN